jgi:hypothetical protein
MKVCRCGCGRSVNGRRVFVNKEHQLEWMVNGGARELNSLQPLEAKVRGGQVAGEHAAASGRLADASQKGAAKAHEIAERFRQMRKSK